MHNSYIPSNVPAVPTVRSNVPAVPTSTPAPLSTIPGSLFGSSIGSSVGTRVGNTVGRGRLHSTGTTTEGVQHAAVREPVLKKPEMSDSKARNANILMPL